MISMARVGRLSLNSGGMSDVPIRRLLIVAAAIFCAAGAPVARAQDASAWDTERHAAARLIAGGAVQSAGATWLRGGVEIRLAPGWKTYWRYPGDSGVPPTLNFAGSENVKSVTALWPAPERFNDGAGGHSIGYVGDFVLPLRIAPQDPARPSALRVTLDYAVCGNLCVPVQASLDLALSGKAGAEDGALAAAEARVPRRVPLGAGGDLAIRAVHRVTEGGHARVVVEVAAPADTPVDLFAEGPTAEWALPLPEPEHAAAGQAAGVRRFSFDLDGLPPGASAAGATLTLTAVSPTEAIEVRAHLD
jgi:DsbC/DsbD-like thiol-disulfide interchange protein